MDRVNCSKREYFIDVVFCVDLTANSASLLEQFKSNCKNMLDAAIDTIYSVHFTPTERGFVSGLNVKIIGFRDSYDNEPLVVSDYYDYFTQEKELLGFVKALNPSDGDDISTSGLDALITAINTSCGEKSEQKNFIKRRLICAISNTTAKLTKISKTTFVYPQKTEERIDTFCSLYRSNNLKNNNGPMLLLFTPDDYYWDNISSGCDNGTHVCINEELGFDISEEIEYFADTVLGDYS